MVNSAITMGEPLDIFCSCTTAMANIETHPCGYCFNQTICRFLVSDGSGVRVCMDHDKYRSRLTDGISVPEQIIRRSLRQATHGERQSLGMNIEEDNVDSMMDDLKTQGYFLQDLQWKDGYCSTPRSVPMELGSRELGSRSPFMPSIDAIFPFISIQGQILTHASGNIAVTALHINLAKHIQLPAWLAELSTYMKGPRNVSVTNKFIQRVNQLYEISLKAPYKKTTRMKAKATSQKLAFDKAEWVTGIPLTKGNIPWRVVPKIRKTPKGWKPDRIDEFIHIAEEIEGKFGVKLPRSKDGCPYPFHRSTMPEDWSWWFAWQLWTDRVYRMTFLCNGILNISKFESITLICLRHMDT
jgi:hypothetical protein